MEIKNDNFAQLYDTMAYRLANYPEYMTSPRGLKIKEIMNAQLIIRDPQSCLFTNNARDLPLKYLSKELCLYLMGAKDVTRFKQASSMWERLANPDNTINSAYGNLLFNIDARDMTGFTQFDWSAESLEHDKESRQAIMHFNRTQHQVLDVKDFTCTMYGNFHIRDNKLNFKISMRSNDIFFGMTFDIPFFCVLQLMMLDRLKITYPNLTLGTYTHCADSLHLYEKDFKIINKMTTTKSESVKIPIPTANSILHPALFDMYDKKIFNSENIEPEDLPFFMWLFYNMT